MPTLKTMIGARAETPSPLQELRRIRRENLSDRAAVESARVNNELKRLQIQQAKDESAAARSTSELMATAFTGQQGGGAQAQPPWMSPAGKQPPPEQAAQAQQNIKNRLAENPQMISDMRRVRTKLYSLGNPTATEKAVKLDGIITQWEQRNYFKKKAMEDERIAIKTSDTEAARAWFSTPESDKVGRFEEFKQAHGITGIDSVGDMDVWARDLKAAAEDSDLNRAGGPMKPATANALLTRAEKIKKNFDAEIMRMYPEISTSGDGGLLVDASYDQVRADYAKAVNKAAQSNQQFDPNVLFAQTMAEYRLVQQPNTGWGDGLDDMDRDVFVPIAWMNTAKQQNGELTEDQIAVLYSTAINDKLKNQGKTSTKTWNLFVRHGLAQ